MGPAEPEELEDAALPDAVAEDEAEEDGVEDEVALKSFWLVTVAVNPVTLVQLDETVLLIPVTKLTAAH